MALLVKRIAFKRCRTIGHLCQAVDDIELIGPLARNRSIGSTGTKTGFGDIDDVALGIIGVAERAQSRIQQRTTITQSIQTMGQRLEATRNYCDLCRRHTFIEMPV